MTLSKPDVPNTVPDIPVVAQHYLVCGTEDCMKNCQFYCNPCHRQLCEQCRVKHQTSPETKNHEVVPYRQRKIQLPVEKCKDHPKKDIDILCQDCQVSICSKCAMQDHQKHKLKDLEVILSEKFNLCLEKIYEIHQFFIPNSQDMQRDIKENAKDIKEIIDDIRRSMKTEIESLKSLLDTALSDNIEQVNKMEESVIENLKSQDKTYQDYISYLEDLVIEFNGYMSSTKLHNNPLIFSLSDQLKTKPIPETIKPAPPVFTAAQYSKEDVTKLLGKVTVPDTGSTQNNTKKLFIHLFILLLVLLLSSSIPDLNIDNQKSDADKHTKEQLEKVTEKYDVDNHNKDQLEKVTEKYDVDNHTKEQLEKEKSDDNKHTKEQLEKDKENSDADKHTKEQLGKVKEKSDVDKHTKKQLEKVKDNSDVDNHTKEQLEKVKENSDVDKHAKEHLKRDKQKSDVKSILSLFTSVTKVKEYTVSGVDDVNHISLGKSGTLWVSDLNCNLVQTDLRGNQLQKMKTSYRFDGYHTVTQDGDLIFTDRENTIINRIALDNTITEFIKTGDWRPISIHSSQINGDILVGMVWNGQAKVTRYNKKGEEIQNIQRDNKGQGLYGDPHYITENINGDICVSDFDKQAVVVVNKLGQHRFSYTGPGSKFLPNGICTDVIGHILVSDFMSESVHILDQDGQYLSKLLSWQEVNCPISVWVDGENDIHVGQCNTDTVPVYKYLQ